MEQKIKVKTETHMMRCPVCHCTDKWDMQREVCNRCCGIEKLIINDKEINLLVHDSETQFRINTMLAQLMKWKQQGDEMEAKINKDWNRMKIMLWNFFFFFLFCYIIEKIATYWGIGILFKFN